MIVVPYWYLLILYYAINSRRISDEKKLALFKKIITNINREGNVEVRSYGMENIPKDQSFMYFPNHEGTYDVLALFESSPYFFSVVMKKELENKPFLKRIFQIMEAHSIDRKDIRQSMKVILKVSEEVSSGKNFLIFPEGTRSRGGKQIDFKGGSFKSATKAKCPIVPVAIIDSYKVFDCHCADPVVVQVHYLEPLYYEQYKMLKTTEIAEIVGNRIKKTVENIKKSS